MLKRITLLAITLFSLVITIPTALAANTNVIISTTLGDIEVALDSEKAPISVANFLDYANSGFYTETLFHRVIPGFMVQGGGFDTSMTQKQPKAPIKNEANNGLKNNRGTIAMARTPVVDSATSQFFINVVDNDFLNYTAPNQSGYGYAVFGHVVKGMDVADKIAAVATDSKDAPLTQVKILSVKVIK